MHSIAICLLLQDRIYGIVPFELTQTCGDRFIIVTWFSFLLEGLDKGLTGLILWVCPSEYCGRHFPVLRTGLLAFMLLRNSCCWFTAYWTQALCFLRTVFVVFHFTH